MAFIHRPSGGWLIQPPGPQEIDWDSPLAQGLIGLSTPTTSTSTVLFGGNYRETVGPEGREFSTINLTSTEPAAYFEAPSEMGVSGDTTVFVVFRRFSGSTVAPVVFQENTNVDGYERVRSAMTVSGSNWLWRTRDVVTGDTGSFDDLRIATPVNGRLEARMFTAQTGDKRAYLNGKLDAFSSTGQPFTEAPASKLTFCASGDGPGTNHTCHISLYATFRGAKGIDEAAELARNPWQLFRPSRRKRIYFDVSTPGAPLSSFWANVGGVPTRSLGLRAWNGSAAVTPVAKRWTGSAWEEFN